jgi:hypothetical protein
LLVQFSLKRLRTGGSYMALSEEQEKWLSKIDRDTKNMKKVPAEFLTEEFYLAAVRQFGDLLEYVPAALRTEALCLAAVQQYSFALQFVPDALKTEAVCLAAVQEARNEALEYVPKNLKTAEIYFEAYKPSGFMNYRTPDEYFRFLQNAVPEKLYGEVRSKIGAYMREHNMREDRW